MLYLLNSKIKSKIIREYASNPNLKTTASELARKLKISKSRASEILRYFKKEGILKCKRFGNVLIYEINKSKKVMKFLEMVKRLDSMRI